MERVIIVGAGVVGTAGGRGLRQLGHDVTFVDVDRSRVEALRAEGYEAGDTIDLSGPSALVFLSVPTPLGPTGFDLTHLRAASRAVGRALRRGRSIPAVVVRSTVPPGTCDEVVGPEIEASSGRREGSGFTVASNPEFLRAASALEDFVNPWMTVVASRSAATVDRLSELYRPLGGQLRTFSTPVTAEMIKCSHNIYNAAKISFWNEMWRIAEAIDIPLADVAETVALSAEGSTNIWYGIRGGAPYGGSCLPKDTAGFHAFAAGRGIDMPLLASVIGVNESMQTLPAGDAGGGPAEGGGPTVIDISDRLSESLRSEEHVAEEAGSS